MSAERISRAGAAVLLIVSASATPPSPAALELQAAVSRAIAAGDSAVTILPGDYYFHDSAFNITNSSGISIGGIPGAAATTQLFFGAGFGVAVESARNATLHDFTIDYSPLPYGYGAVTAASATQFTIVLDDASPTFEALHARCSGWGATTLFDRTSGDRIAQMCQWGAPPPLAPIPGQPRQYLFPCNGSAAAPGDVLAAGPRCGFTLVLYNCSGTLVQSVSIHAAGNMAITELQGDGGNSFVDVRVAPRSAATPVGSNADGFHSVGARAGPSLQRVQLRNVLDDYFNVHNTFQVLVERVSDRSVLVGDYSLGLAAQTLLPGGQPTLFRLGAGDALSFFPLNTYSYPPLATAPIVSIQEVTGAAAREKLAAAHAATSAAATVGQQQLPWCPDCFPGLMNYSTASLWAIAFAAPLPPSVAPPLTLVNADALSNTGALVSDSHFSGSACNLGLFKSSHGTVRRSTFRNTAMLNLEVAALQNWYEGMLGIHNVTIDSNVFCDVPTDPVRIFGAVGVRVTNNTYDPRPCALPPGLGDN